MNAAAIMTETYIGKCKTKGCKHSTRVEMADVQEIDSYRKPNGVYTTPEGAEYIPARPYILNNMNVCARCPDHGVYRLAFLQGRYSADHVCDGRCMGATGPNCECSCGGANHGANHG